MTTSKKSPELGDELEKKFSSFLKDGDVGGVTKNEVGYLKHCLAKVSRNGGDTFGHPMFALWQMKYGGERIEEFLLNVASMAKRKGWM